MNLDWNENKNSFNISKHGIDFKDVSDVFYDKMIIQKDNREEYGEDSILELAKLTLS